MKRCPTHTHTHIFKIRKSVRDNSSHVIQHGVKSVSFREPPCVVFVSLQCVCGWETALYANAPRQTSGHKDRSSVHQQSSVRFLLTPKQPHIYTHTHTNEQTTDYNYFFLYLFLRLLVKFPELNYQLKIKVCIDKWVYASCQTETE